MDEVSTSKPSSEIKKPKAEADYTAGIYFFKTFTFRIYCPLKIILACN
jgi:hypothetical protein